jgi:alpha-mannosidase
MGGDCCNRTVSTMYPQLAVEPVGKQIHSIYQSRLRQFTDNGQYREQGLIGYVHNHKPLPHSEN